MPRLRDGLLWCSMVASSLLILLVFVQVIDSVYKLGAGIFW
jgi:hypothetical protein